MSYLNGGSLRPWNFRVLKIWVKIRSREVRTQSSRGTDWVKVRGCNQQGLVKKVRPPALLHGNVTWYINHKKACGFLAVLYFFKIPKPINSCTPWFFLYSTFMRGNTFVPHCIVYIAFAHTSFNLTFTAILWNDMESNLLQVRGPAHGGAQDFNPD